MAREVRERPLFLRWLLLNTVVSVLGAAAALKWHEHLIGVHLVGIPVIVAIAVYASVSAGRLCWEAGELAFPNHRQVIVHRAEYLEHWAWVCAMIGILSSIAGMSILLSDDDPSTLATRVSDGGGAIFYSTFAGVLAMLHIRHQHRMIEHELGGSAS